jgi:hypothetical protein
VHVRVFVLCVYYMHTVPIYIYLVTEYSIVIVHDVIINQNLIVFAYNNRPINDTMIKPLGLSH